MELFHLNEVPMMSETDTNSAGQTRPGSKPMHIAMMACCVVMLLPIAGYFVAGGTLSGVGANLATFAPLLLCVGAHFVMHKMMGKTCHGNEERTDAEPPREDAREGATTIPQVRRG